MKRNLLQASMSQMFLAIFLLCLNLVGASATARYYPRPVLHRYGTSSGYTVTFNNEDGSVTVYWARNGLLGSLTNPHVIHPPRPTIRRIWAPFACCAILTLVTLLMLYHRERLPFAIDRRCLVVIAVLIYLTLPIFRIMCCPENDYHIHSRPNLYNGRNVLQIFHSNVSVHANPLWHRYWRLLIFQPWPGSYKCRLSPHVSIPTHNVL